MVAVLKWTQLDASYRGLAKKSLNYQPTCVDYWIRYYYGDNKYYRLGIYNDVDGGSFDTDSKGDYAYCDAPAEFWKGCYNRFKNTKRLDLLETLMSMILCSGSTI